MTAPLLVLPDPHALARRCSVAGRTREDCHDRSSWDTSGTKTPSQTGHLVCVLICGMVAEATLLDSSLVPALCTPLSRRAASHHGGVRLGIFPFPGKKVKPPACGGQLEKAFVIVPTVSPEASPWSSFHRSTHFLVRGLGRCTLS